MEGRAVVSAVAACLNDDASREAEPGAQCEQHIRSRIIGPILGLRNDGEVRHWTKDEAMGISRSQRQNISRPRRKRMPTDHVERGRGAPPQQVPSTSMAWVRSKADYGGCPST